MRKGYHRRSQLFGSVADPTLKIFQQEEGGEKVKIIFTLGWSGRERNENCCIFFPIIMIHC